MGKGHNGKQGKRHPKIKVPAVRYPLLVGPTLFPNPLPYNPSLIPPPILSSHFTFANLSLPDVFKNVTNCSIFNFTSIQLPSYIQKFLSLTTKFRSKPKDDDNDVLRLAFTEFSRIVRIRSEYRNSNTVKDVRLHVKRPDHQPPNIINDPIVNLYLTDAGLAFEKALTEMPLIANPGKDIYESIISEIIRMSDRYGTIICNTDKGLGIALLYNDHYSKMALDHLNDHTTYSLLPSVYNRYYSDLTPNHPCYDNKSTQSSEICRNIFHKIKVVLLNHNQLFKAHPLSTHNSHTTQRDLLNSSLYVTMDGVKLLLPNPDTLDWNRLTDVARFILQMEYTTITRIPCFYILPKVHKPYKSIDEIKGRPIVSSFNSPTYHSSKYVDIILNKLVKSLDTNLKDSTSLLLLLEGKIFEDNCYIMTADVTALYPNIDITDGIKMLRDILYKYLGSNTIPEIKTSNDIDFIVNLTEIVLKNNYVQFGDKMWLQQQGTAMGTPLAVVFANIYMTGLHIECVTKCLTLNPYPFSTLNTLPPLISDLFNPPLHYTIIDGFFTLSTESQLQLNKLIQPEIPLDNYLYNYDKYVIFERFIDDIFSIWNNKYSPLIYITVFNSLRPTIKLTYDISFNTGIMMDLRIFKGPNFVTTHTFTTELYYKPMNKFLYLPYDSYHDSYQPTVTAECKRIRTFCMNDNTNHKMRCLYKNNLSIRGYPIDILNDWFQAATFKRDDLISILEYKAIKYKLSLHKKHTQIPLLFKIKRCHRSIMLRTAKILNMNNRFSSPRYHNIFPKNPLLCKKAGPNLGSLLCSSKFRHKITDIQLNLT